MWSAVLTFLFEVHAFDFGISAVFSGRFWSPQNFPYHFSINPVWGKEKAELEGARHFTAPSSGWNAARLDVVSYDDRGPADGEPSVHDRSARKAAWPEGAA